MLSYKHFIYMYYSDTVKNPICLTNSNIHIHNATRIYMEYNLKHWHVIEHNDTTKNFTCAFSCNKLAFGTDNELFHCDIFY